MPQTASLDFLIPPNVLILLSYLGSLWYQDFFQAVAAVSNEPGIFILYHADS